MASASSPWHTKMYSNGAKLHAEKGNPHEFYIVLLLYKCTHCTNHKAKCTHYTGIFTVGCVYDYVRDNCCDSYIGPGPSL